MKPFQTGFGRTIKPGTFIFLLLATALFRAPVYGDGCVAPPSGLVAWWPLEGKATDLVGNHTGTIIGTVTPISAEVGLGLALEDVPSGISVPDAPDLNFGPHADFSIEAWVRPEVALTSYDVMNIVDKRLVTSDLTAVGYELYLGSGRIAFEISDSTSKPVQLVGLTGPDLRDGSWHHVAVTVHRASTTGGNLYVDDSLIATFDPTGNQGDLSNTQPLLIGLHPNYPRLNANFKGGIDEVSLYNRALSRGEVQSIFDAGHSGKCATPVPPTIYSQPANQTVLVGQTATLTVGATGTAPLVYQWTFDGAPLEGATNASLVLANVQVAQGGTYAVLVTNKLGSAVSSNAVLTVNLAPPCTTAPSGLVGWWRAEGNAFDEIGGNTGANVNGTGFSQGEVGRAFDFNGIDQLIRIPDAPALNPPTALTLEAWVFIRVFSHESVAIIGKDDPYSPLRQYMIGMGNKTGHWAFRAHIGTPGNYFNFDGQTALSNYTWYHVAMTYDGSVLKLFVNGNLDGSLPVTGPITVSDMPLLIGGHAEGPWNFNGLVDEVSLYNRALSADEIQSIYHSDSAGKCVTPIPPVIYFQPMDQAVTVGQSAAFTVGARGTQPLSYQWTFNGAPIPNASEVSLVITNVQRSDAGVYSVIVSNSLGFATSSNALLTVNLPPAPLMIGNAQGAGGTVVTVPVEIIANGNENALGFSLDFPPALLALASITPGAGISGATFVSNTNQIIAGTLGILISLPPDQALKPGTQELAQVSFVAAALTNTALAQLFFGDQPAARQLSDVQANPLPATYGTGSILISPATFEGDVTPRPDGDKKVTVTDWVLAGRYAAKLDAPRTPAEYQRADCAPRETLGDGVISVADWVQVGRYAAGLDPVTVAGGPTNDVGPNAVSTSAGTKERPGTLAHHSNDLNPRRVRIAGVSLAQGQSANISVLLEAQGNENAAGFTVQFDPAVFSYNGAMLGADVSGATLEINSSQAASGQIAFALALPSGSSLNAGSKELVKLNLRAAYAVAGNYLLGLNDQIVLRQVVDPQAASLKTDYLNGSITINPAPTLSITASQQTLTLSWPAWASNFVLQQAESPSLVWTKLTAPVVVTSNSASVQLPLTATTRFYRLQSP